MLQQQKPPHRVKESHRDVKQTDGGRQEEKKKKRWKEICEDKDDIITERRKRGLNERGESKVMYKKGLYHQEYGEKNKTKKPRGIKLVI